ncbi:MAG: acyl-CoA dehydrogenase family protein [Novosphingobium sp.]|uniref:acyl-CoA dehydrogenase family protein n=1 Tax=Novosphingobium sp. TaxID=1874826 RepID=UPI0030179F9F
MQMDLGVILSAAQTYREAARSALARRLANRPVDAEQRAAHGFAWIATSVAALEAVHAWAEAGGGTNPLDAKVAELAFAETLGQLTGALLMGPAEMLRPADLGLTAEARALAEAAAPLLDADMAETRAALAAALAEGQWPSETLHDPELDEIRAQFRRFTDAEILPHAHKWHLANALIPDETVRAMADLGTFGVCIPEEYGGLGLGKLVMCLVSEELSRGWIGAGSLGTRSEIAGELIMLGGTEAQKAEWLPRIAAGETLPVAVFTEPDIGSDLGALTTRAQRDDSGDWVIHGAKTWITHAARSDVMTLLVRTLPDAAGYAGLSMLLVPKPRGTEENPFPADGMTGSEIEVLGYRGMREYTLQFDGMHAPAEALLGGKEGAGFKQLMQTFEGARIQTAARAVGTARRALELGLAYALQRKQFGQALINFPRVADKLAVILAEYVTARELSYAAARAKDAGRRCDIEAGMAKLHAARAAWTAADASLQIHGGNGYALEYEISRVLCDARILSIFEGAAEIQAQVIARGLMAGRG